MTIYGKLRSVFQIGGAAKPLHEGKSNGGHAPNMKVCSRCKQEKPITDFYKNNNNKSGLDSHCKSCHNTRINERRRKQRKALRELTKAIPSEVIPLRTKVCNICKQEKPITEFYTNTTKKDGLDSYCKPCRNIMQRDRYRKEKDLLKKVPQKTPAPSCVIPKVPQPQIKQVVLPATAKALVQKTEAELLTELKNDQILQGQKLDELTRKLNLLLESQTTPIVKKRAGGV